MARIHISSGVDIAVGAPEAWAVVVDFARNPQWQSGMQSCVWLTPPPVAVGSRYQQEARFLWRTITTTFEVVELVEHAAGGGRVTIASIVSTFPLRVTREVVARPNGCRVTADVAGVPNGALALAGPVMAKMVKRSVDGDYRRLRHLLEG